MKHRRLGLAALLSLLLLLATVAGGAFACAATPADLGLAAGRLHPCPASPNCVCSEDPTAAAALAPLAYTGDGPLAFAALVELVAAEPDAELVTVEPGYAHAVYRTPLLRFRDDLELRLDEAAGVIQVRSASRVGYSDLGANRRRVEALRARWQGRTRAAEGAR